MVHIAEKRINNEMSLFNQNFTDIFISRNGLWPILQKGAGLSLHTLWN